MWDIFEHPNVELWPSAKQRLLPDLFVGGGVLQVDSFMLRHESYDSYILRDYHTKSATIETVIDLLRQQINGEAGVLQMVVSDNPDTGKNVFFLEGKRQTNYSLSARWYKSNVAQRFVWSILLFERPRLGVWPDWGCYRAKGTKVFSLR